MGEGPIDVEELLSLPIFYNPEVSWDGYRVAFFWNKTGRHELYIRDIGTGETRQISHGQLPRSPKALITWSRDNRYIVTGIDAAGNEQHDLYGFDLETGGFVEITRSPGQNYLPEFSPDNREMIFLSTRRKQRNLYLLDWETKEVSQLTDFDNPVFRALWSPDGEWVYFYTNESKNLSNMDIYRIRRDGTGLELFFRSSEGSEDSISDISDSHLAAITSDIEGLCQPGVLDLRTGEVTWLGDRKHEEFAREFSPDGKYLLTIKYANAEARPFLYETATGKTLDLALPKGLFDSVQFAHRDKIFLVHSSPTTRSRMLLYGPRDGKYQVVQEADYGGIDREGLSDAECVTYRSFDGTEIEAVLYKPKSMKVGDRVPAIVLVHGGPRVQVLLCFHIYAQSLASLGFAVLLPNYRGSFGYGRAFCESLIMDWGGKEAEDIARGARYLKALDWVDGNRIAIAGGSHGGYETFWQMVRYPEVWKAGVAWLGITDLPRFYEESMPHFKYFFRYYMGDPEENRDLWIERSPVTHVRDFKGPLLMIHGVNDPRCPVTQARVFRDKLLATGFKQGVDFEYRELGEEGHGSSDKAQMVREHKLMLDFLKRKLL